MRSAAGLLGRDVVHQNLRVAQLANVVVLDVLVAQQRREMVEGLVGFLADGFLHLHLQDQVRAALQVQAELDALRKIRFDSGPATWEENRDSPTKPITHARMTAR